MQPVIFPKTMHLSRDDLTRLWSRLGIAFAAEPAAGHVDLEKTLLLSLSHASGQRKILRLIAEWLNMNADLVHVERLASLSRSGSWTDAAEEQRETRTLGALAHFLVISGDRRWQVMVKLCQQRLEGAAERLPVDPDVEFLVRRDGADPHFSPFGITMPSLFRQRDPSANEKKLHNRDRILTQNPWLRLRAALGANWRSDVLFVILAKLAENPHRTTRVLGCSYETAHRIWQAAEGARAAELFHVERLMA